MHKHSMIDPGFESHYIQVLLNRLRNISQVAVRGQIVSDGAHSILDPAGREICAFVSGPKDPLKITR
jgi:hypothetical protein